MNRRLQTLSILGAAILTGLLSVGCGGNTDSENALTGRAAVYITWPERTRLIPDASNAITIEVRDGDAILAQRTVARPTSGSTTERVEFLDLPNKDLSLTATAYPNADGTGTAQASAERTITIVRGETTEFGITMVSTIDHIAITPVDPTLLAESVLQLTATAEDAQNQMILIDPANAVWTSGNVTVATVDANGLVTGLKSGRVTITFTDTESGVSGSVLVTVFGPGLGG
ncbi:MAG: Ig-like domain-containing protein [Fimbriimonadaceae bacterium]|nr:Ig-like domain-containing protein [Fimbriimonadaceae bacterium]